jgi:hypothetical protein
MALHTGCFEVSFANSPKELMKHNEQALYENVLKEMADDYESFEYLLEHSKLWATEEVKA